MESAEDERLCRKKPQEALSNLQAVDCKLEFLIKELKRYRGSVGAIQETKWFGSDLCRTEGYTFCTRVICCLVGMRMLPERKVLVLLLMKRLPLHGGQHETYAKQ